MGSASPNRQRRANRDQARRPDITRLGPSVRGACPKPNAGWRDPRRTGDLDDPVQSADLGDSWNPAANAFANEHAGRLRESVERLVRCEKMVSVFLCITLHGDLRQLLA